MRPFIALALAVSVLAATTNEIPAAKTDVPDVSPGAAPVTNMPAVRTPAENGVPVSDGTSNQVRTNTAKAATNANSNAFRAWLASLPKFKIQPSSLNHHIVAYYGRPRSIRMGILGRHSREELVTRIRSTASNYICTNNKRATVSAAFYIVYGMCTPGGEISLLDKKTVETYIAFAQSNNMLVFLDHQIGKYSVHSAMRALLPFLMYSNVHLGLDPEWRTDKPMEEIGIVSAAEINEAQSNMQAYILTNRLPGKRMLVIPQFHEKMLVYRRSIRANYDPVVIVHSTSGIGAPAAKRAVHMFNSLATNMPNKAFKLWYPSEKTNIAYDKPIMKPEEVMSLRPEPMLIIYQ